MRSRHGWGTMLQSTRLGHEFSGSPKGTVKATEEWTDGGHAEDDMCVELDFELAWQTLVGGCVPKSLAAQLWRYNPYLRHPKDAMTQ